jgi:hypothetical protein
VIVLKIITIFAKRYPVVVYHQVDGRVSNRPLSQLGVDCGFKANEDGSRAIIHRRMTSG